MRSLLFLAVAACGAAAVKPVEKSTWIDPDVRAGKPRPPAARPPAPSPQTVVIRDATLLTATGKRIEHGSIVLADGKIAAIGAEVASPPGASVIDAHGRFVTPGLIDAHSHIGVGPSPSAVANEDVNEMTDPNTASAAAEYAYTPQDPSIARALAGGVTTALILPGSANLIGGRGLTVVMRPARTLEAARFPGAPATIKMAFGENPKRTYGAKSGPGTRMGELAAVRAWFRAAAEHGGKQAVYKQRRAEWEAKRAKGGKPESAPDPVAADAKLETLAAVLRGEILVQIHCYTARDLERVVALSDEVGFQVRAFHHGLEAYKVRDLLVAHGIGLATWSDWWGFKLEAWDGIRENAALFTESGGRAAIHSDSPIGIQRLNQDAGKALAAGRAAGIDVSDDQALRWVTANPAWILGIDDVTGTLEAGKRADVVLWSAHPFSVYARADQVFIAGELAYDRARGMVPSDFELGNSALDAEVRP